MLTYKQSTGELFVGNDRLPLIQGYSGADKYKNDPLSQAVHNKGPIPQGEWGIVGPPVDTATHGPNVLHLYPKPGTETYGRSGFLIHGDSIAHPGEASEGCIVLPSSVRIYIWKAGDLDLRVVA